VLFSLLATEARTKKKSECGALVVNVHIINPRYRLRPLFAAALATGPVGYEVIFVFN
jgi:hypothetical protein